MLLRLQIKLIKWILGFEWERRTRKIFSKQSREPTNSTNIHSRGRKSNPGHSNGRLGLSPSPWFQGTYFLTDVEWTFFFFFRETLIILLIGGATKLPLIQQEERLGSTSQKPSYQRIGTHLSLRSVSAWEGWGNGTSISLSSPKGPTPCIRLLETETTVQPLSAATNG